MKNILSYDGCNLIWNVTNSPRAKKGTIAGCKQKNGYIVVRVDKILYYAHRIIWEMHFGKIPEGMEVDHINHIRHDNRIENLRLVTHRDNCRNQSKRKTNTSGFSGVWFSKEKQKFVGEVLNKKLGYFSSSIDAYNTVANELKYKGFHHNHGK